MSSLLCTVYKGSREDELYLYVAKGDDLSQLPADLLSRMGELQEVMTLELTAEKKLARVKAENVLEEIRQKGYFLQLPPKFNPAIFTHGG